LQQQLDQTGFIGFIQTGQPSRSTGQPSRSPSPPQSNVAAFLMFLPPPADGLVTHLQTTADFAVVEALFSNNFTASSRRFSRATKSRLTPRALPMFLDTAGSN